MFNLLGAKIETYAFRAQKEEADLEKLLQNKEGIINNSKYISAELDKCDKTLNELKNSKDYVLNMIIEKKMCLKQLNDLVPNEKEDHSAAMLNVK